MPVALQYTTRAFGSLSWIAITALAISVDFSSFLLSNRFAFTFCVDGEKAAQIPAVLPSLTGEAIKQIEVLAASKEVPDWDH